MGGAKRKRWRVITLLRLATLAAPLTAPLLASPVAPQWIAKDSTPDYLIKAEKALEDEKERVLNYLNSHSESKVLRVCEEELLEKVRMGVNNSSTAVSTL